LSFSRPGDYIFDVIDISSPIGLVRSSEASVASFAQKDIEIMASILARYSDSNSENVNVSYKILPSAEYSSLIVDSASEDLLKSLRI
jgi:hypothetical protein